MGKKEANITPDIFFPKRLIIYVSLLWASLGNHVNWRHVGKASALPYVDTDIKYNNLTHIFTEYFFGLWWKQFLCIKFNTQKEKYK